MPDFGRILIVVGLVLLLMGAAFVFLPRLGINIGSLPGDFSFGFGQTTCLIPLATSIILSILLTFGLNLLGRFFNH
jgi:DUF2905 family protein